jgi:hypothetical protein
LLQGGGFGLVLLDLADVPAREARRIISSWWYRFRRVVENTSSAFVVISPESCVRSCASLTLEMKRGDELWCATSNPFATALGETQAEKLGQYPGSLHRAHATNVDTNPLLPTHSKLLRGMRLRLERQKPVYLGERTAKFVAQLSN